MSDLLGRTWTRDRNAIVQFALNGHRLENRIQLHAKMTFGETFGAAAVAGYAGPGFHNWPPSHIPQDTDTNPLLRSRAAPLLKNRSERRPVRRTPPPSYPVSFHRPGGSGVSAPSYRRTGYETTIQAAPPPL